MASDGRRGPADIIPEPDWRRAKCLQADPEAFYPEVGDTAKEAKRVCSMCPIKQACGEYALATNEPHGIWGGMSEGQRAKLLGRRRVGKFMRDTP